MEILRKSVGGLLFSFWLAIGFSGMAQQPVSKADKRPYSFSLTTQLHSTGHSIYSGVYLNHDPNVEMTLSYEYKQIGGFISKNVDFVDAHSPINYSTVAFFKYFKFGESLKITSYVGYFLKQTNSFMDNGSDVWAGVQVKFTVNKWLSIENTSLLGNLVLNHASASLANRLNTSISVGKFRLDAYAWYTHTFSGTPYFVSASLAITSPNWIITPSVSARLQVAILQQISEDVPEGAMYRGGLISLIVPIDFSPITK
jgi:hypothetical protein